MWVCLLVIKYNITRHNPTCWNWAKQTKGREPKERGKKQRSTCSHTQETRPVCREKEWTPPSPQISGNINTSCGTVFKELSSFMTFPRRCTQFSFICKKNELKQDAILKISWAHANLSLRMKLAVQSPYYFLRITPGSLFRGHVYPPPSSTALPF